VQDQQPKTKKPVIKIRLDVSGTTADVEDGEETAEVKNEGRVLSLPLSQFQSEPQRVKLVSYWLDVVTQVQNERNNSLKKATDTSKDPLAVTPKKGELKVTLGGGFTIETSSKQRPKRLYSSASLADVHTWLDAAVALLQGSFEQKLHLESGLVVLQRVGRGGALVSIKVGSEKALFDLADFILAVRSAAKDFLPFVGRCIVTLKNGVKQFLQEGEAEQYTEREATIKAVLKHQNLDRALKSLKHLLEVGAVPNSNLPQLFAKKRAEKMRSQSQAFIEYENMWDFVTSNLPSDYEKAKEEAVRLNEQAEKDRDAARARLDEAKQKQIEERKAKELSKQAVKQEKSEDKSEEKKVQKDKKVEVKTVDKDGWVSREVRTLKSDGSVEAAEAETEPEPEPEPEQKKGKKGKSKQNQQENKANQKNQKPAAASASPKVSKPAEEASKEFLDSNPYAAAMREGSFQSVAESQFKRNMEKAGEKPKQKQSNQQQNQQKGPKAQAAQSKPKPADQQSAQQKKQKQPQQAKAQKEAKKAMKAKPVVAQNDYVVPAVVVAGVVIAIAVAYTVLIGA